MTDTGPVFNRDESVEKNAYDSGWSVDRIKRTRLSDIKAHLLKKEPQATKDVNLNKEISFKPVVLQCPLSKTTFRIPVSQRQVLNADWHGTKCTLSKMSIPSPQSQVSNDDDDLYDKKCALELELKRVTEKQNKSKNCLLETKSHKSFNLKDICKLKDAPIRIHNYFENICKEHRKKINY
jgi:hypothetical protein